MGALGCTGACKFFSFVTREEDISKYILYYADVIQRRWENFFIKQFFYFIFNDIGISAIAVAL